MKKKIALLGGTGKTGSHFLSQALAEGFEVKALARNPSKISDSSPNLEVIKGDVLNPTDIENLIEGCDVVVSLFGHVKGSPEWLQTNGTNNIVAAMQKYGTDRIISLSGGGLPYPEKDKPKFVDKLIRTIMKIAVPKILNDAIEHHKFLKNSEVKWTIVRGPRLTDDEPAGTYREGWVGVNASTKISRADLASFIVKEVKEEKYNFQLPFISN